jgi:hypothetical protein
MSTIRFAFINLGIGAVVPNVVAGSTFEFIGRPSRVTVRGAVEAVTTTPAVAQVQFGSDLQCETSPLPVVVGGEPTRETPPLADDVAEPGDRIVIRLTNADSAVRDIVFHLDVVPLA